MLSAQDTAPILSEIKVEGLKKSERSFIDILIHSKAGKAIDSSLVQAGALVSKGGAALGTDFRIGGFTNYNPTSNYSTFLSVMATENTTLITINNILDGIDIIDFNETELGV